MAYSLDTNADLLRAKVEEIAEQVSRQLSSPSASDQPFFINEIVSAVENAVGDVVHVAQDAVDHAVNVSHDLVTALENAGERTVWLAENVLDSAINHTVAVLNVTHAIVNLEVTAPMPLVNIGGLY